MKVLKSKKIFVAKHILPNDAINDVVKKYMIVLRAIFPLREALRLAAPVIRLAMTSGSIISCSSLMNISPGYANSDIIEDDRDRDLNENPRMTPSKTPKNVITNRRLDLNHP